MNGTKSDFRQKAEQLTVIASESAAALALPAVNGARGLRPSAAGRGENPHLAEKPLGMLTQAAKHFERGDGGVKLLG